MDKIRNFADFDRWYRREVAKQLLIKEKETSMGTYIERWLRDDKEPNGEKSSDQSNTETDR